MYRCIYFRYITWFTFVPYNFINRNVLCKLSDLHVYYFLYIKLFAIYANDLKSYIWSRFIYHTRLRYIGWYTDCWCYSLINLLTTCECGVVYTFGLVGQSVCLSVCPVVRALTFESLDVETAFLVWRYIFRISRPSSYVKVIGSMSRSHVFSKVIVVFVPLPDVLTMGHALKSRE